jgi:hypothetical protein
MFTDEDLKTTDRVAVISYRFWGRRFHSDLSVVGRTISLNGRSFSIVGVMPDRVEFPEAADLWIPRSSDAQLASKIAAPVFVARLAPTASASGARSIRRERSVARVAGHSHHPSSTFPFAMTQ